MSTQLKPKTPSLIDRLMTNDGWMPGLIAMMMVMTLAVALGSAELIRSLDMMRPLVWTTFFGFIAGIALSKSRFPAWTAHMYAFVYGIFMVAFMFGLEAYPELTPWRERIIDMISRQADWFRALANGSTSRDAALFLIHTTALMWLLAYMAAWFTYRRPKMWLVIIPSGAVLASVVYSYFGEEFILFRMRLYLAFYCLLALLFIAITYLIARKIVWRDNGIRFENQIIGAVFRSSLLVGLLAMLFAWSMPTMAQSGRVGDAVSRVNRPWRELRDQWQRMYSALDASSSNASDPYRDSVTLGGARNPGETLIMDVYVDEKLPYAYWREAVMDRYDGRSWFVPVGETITHFPDDGDLDIQAGRARQEVEQLFVNYVSNVGSIYGAPEMVSSDKQLLVKTEVDPSGKLQPSVTRARYLLQLNDSYKVNSLLSVADETSLRNSPEVYPTHITDQYLQLPETVTDRTIDLAGELTAEYDNPYDKALVVQNYLRSAIEYNDQVDAPPDGVDAVDYALFESQEGYCNYYAGAMAVMLRSEGIPTRLSRGYASGEFNPDTNSYRVRGKDAHTWVEVYFEGYGWIPFEPTAAIETVEREPGEEDVPEPGADAESIDELDDLLDQQDPLEDEQIPPELDPGADDVRGGGLGIDPQTAVRAIGAIALVALAGFALLVARQMNRGVEGDFVGSYGRLTSWARWLGLPVRASQTPYERADMLATAVPDGKEPIENLTGEFVRRSYSGDKKPSFFVQPLEEWAVLRPLLMRKTARKVLTTRPRLPKRLRRK